MFDPTIFDNLKVAFENQLYDLDNLDEQIQITNRIDRMEMSVMSREFAIKFNLTEQKQASAEVRLEATLKDLAAEIMEMQGETPGCILRLYFHMYINDAELQCNQVDSILEEIWNPELPPIQTLSYEYGQENAGYRNTVELQFNRRINEDQMDDIPELIAHMIQTLTEVNRILV